MSITFVVDEIHDLNTQIYSCDNIQYICTTPACYSAQSEGGGWASMNKEVLADYVNSGYINLVTKETFIDQINAYYLINLSSHNQFKSGIIWKFFDEARLDFLKSTNMPILLYYPLEGVGFFAIEDFLLNLKSKHNLGLSNKLVILTLSDIRTQDGNLIRLSDIHPELQGFQWVYSTAFFSRYTRPNNNNGLTQDTITYWHNHDNIIYKHDYQNKKYDFLCLNNTPSKNRQLLLQELYRRPSLWNNNLISNRFDFLVKNNLHNSCETYKARLVDLIKQEKNFYKDVNVIKSIDQNLNLFDNEFTADSNILKFLQEHMNSVYENHYPLRDLNEEGRARNDNFMLDWYKDSCFTLITETHQWIQDLYMPTPMITEKTIKSIIQHHPFYIFGYSNNHKILHRLGFKTYEDILGLPRDDEMGNLTTIERLYNLVSALERFDRNNLDFDKIEEYAAFNFDHLRNTDWLKLQCELLINPTL